MRSKRSLGWVLAAGLLALGAFDPKCAGSNVTLGTPADDPEVPHRAPSRPEASSTATPSPAASAAPPARTPAEAGTPLERSLGDPVTLTAAPCTSKGNHVRAVVPRPEDLDLSYRGAIAGIEIRRTVRSGTGGYRHAELREGALEVDLWVRGSGLVAGAVGLESCSGGSAADVSFEIVAHYRR